MPKMEKRETTKCTADDVFAVIGILATVAFGVFLFIGGINAVYDVWKVDDLQERVRKIENTNREQAMDIDYLRKTR